MAALECMRVGTLSHTALSTATRALAVQARMACVRALAHRRPALHWRSASSKHDAPRAVPRAQAATGGPSSPRSWRATSPSAAARSTSTWCSRARATPTRCTSRSWPTWRTPGCAASRCSCRPTRSNRSRTAGTSSSARPARRPLLDLCAGLHVREKGACAGR